MEKSLLSVIVPVYNTAKYLARCLDSILRQSYENLEIIIIDDGSTDDSFDVANAFAQKDARIRLFTQKNKGITATRVRGIRESHGHWIGFVDSDDYIEPYMYQQLIDCIERQGCDLVSTSAYHHTLSRDINIWFDNYASGLYKNLPLEIYPTMLHDFHINFKGLRCNLVTKLFHANMLKAVAENVDLRVFYEEDAMILYRYCLLCNSIYIMRDPLYHYVYRQGSAQQRAQEGEAESLYYLYKNLASAFQASPYSDILMRQLRQHILLKEEERVLRGLYGLDMSLLDVWDFSAYRQVFGKRVLVYGAGRCGQAFYKELLRMGYQDRIVSWVDKKPKGVSAENIHPVEPVDVIRDKVYDFVAVAIKNEKMAREAITELQGKWGVPEEKIVWGESSCRSNWNTAYI